MKGLIEAIKIVRNNAVRDPINNAVLPLIGALALFAAWYWGWLPWDVIQAVICHDDLC